MVNCSSRCRRRTAECAGTCPARRVADSLWADGLLGVREKACFGAQQPAGHRDRNPVGGQVGDHPIPRVTSGLSSLPDEAGGRKPVIRCRRIGWTIRTRRAPTARAWTVGDSRSGDGTHRAAMAPIDVQRLVHEVDAAGPPCRSLITRSGWPGWAAVGTVARGVHRGRRVRRPHVSQYLARTSPMRSLNHRPRGPPSSGMPPTRDCSDRHGRAGPALRRIHPDLRPEQYGAVVWRVHDRCRVAVCLMNAFTLGAMTPPARNPERAARRVQHQGNSRVTPVILDRTT